MNIAEGIHGGQATLLRKKKVCATQLIFGGVMILFSGIGPTAAGVSFGKVILYCGALVVICGIALWIVLSCQHDTGVNAGGPMPAAALQGHARPPMAVTAGVASVMQQQQPALVVYDQRAVGPPGAAPVIISAPPPGSGGEAAAMPTMPHNTQPPSYQEASVNNNVSLHVPASASGSHRASASGSGDAFCAQCSNKMPFASKFCPACGTPAVVGQ